MSIHLNDILPISNPSDYKIHFATRGPHEEPLNVFVRDREEWRSWNEARGRRNDFNRPFILSVIRYYHQPNKWLFGGIFEVVSRHVGRYKTALSPFGAEYIGRLLIEHPGPRVRGRAFLLEKHLDDLLVSQVLEKSFEGHEFPGYEWIEITFSDLETLIRQGKRDWKAALENVKGVYLIVDRSCGQMYVGSASGDAGIWARWNSYIDCGHGGNTELRKLLRLKGFEHARNHFFFSLLELRSMLTDDKTMKAREQFWKRVLHSSTFGYNRN